MNPTPDEVASGRAFNTSRSPAVYDHLDTGVGTGYFLDRCKFPSPPRLVLLEEGRRERRARHVMWP